MRQGMGGEHRVARDDEVSDESGGESDDGAADERIAHELGLHDCQPVVLVLQRA
jgi:hypothetical protein